MVEEKKKRGRPRRVAEAEKPVARVTETVVETVVATAETPATEAPKRRGRRPKTEAAAATAVKPPRRRGRPKKTADKTAAQPPRRRGRPKKEEPTQNPVDSMFSHKPAAPRTPEPDELHVLHTESGDYETTYNKMFTRRHRWAAEAPGKILSFMPGTVEHIAVKVGQEVKEGDELMIFRAMKMNNRMLSPVSGRVRAINVSVGDNVPKNTLMIEF
jgi:biotin carboxyl carrier protein